MSFPNPKIPVFHFWIFWLSLRLMTWMGVAPIRGYCKNVSQWLTKMWQYIGQKLFSKNKPIPKVDSLGLISEPAPSTPPKHRRTNSEKRKNVFRTNSVYYKVKTFKYEDTKFLELTMKYVIQLSRKTQTSTITCIKKDRNIIWQQLVRIKLSYWSLGS